MTKFDNYAKTQLLFLVCHKTSACFSRRHHFKLQGGVALITMLGKRLQALCAAGT